MNLKVFKNFLVAVLMGQMILPAQAYAGAPNLGRKGVRHFFDRSQKVWENDASLRVRFGNTRGEIRARRTMVERARATGKKAVEGTISSHPGQLSILLFTLSLVESTRQRAEELRNKNQNLTLRDFLSLANLSATSLMNSFDLYSSILGATAVNRAASPFLKSLRSTVQNKVSSKLFANLINSGVGSFVTFVGWEAGSQLWEESIDMLNDEQLIKEAQQLKFTHILSGKASARQKQVYGKVLENAWDILRFADPDVTTNWFANTWRLKIATGEFVVLVTSMVSAGAVAGTFVGPGVGTLAGACFGLAGGLVGGLLAMYVVPESVKRKIDDDIKDSRRSVIQASLDVNRREIFEPARMLDRAGSNNELLLKRIHRAFLSRGQIRRRYLTTYAEQYYAVQSKIAETEFHLQLVNLNYPGETRRSSSVLRTALGLAATAVVPAMATTFINVFGIKNGKGTGGKQLRDQYTHELNDLKARRRFIEIAMVKFYNNDFVAIRSLLNEESITKRPELTKIVQREAARIIYDERNATYAMFVGLNPEQNPLRGLLTSEEAKHAAAIAPMILTAHYNRGYQF